MSANPATGHRFGVFPRRPAWKILLAAVGAGLLLAGCGENSDPLTAPADNAAVPRTGVLTASGKGQSGAPGQWYEVARADVGPADRKIVSGSRYALTFPRRSMPLTTTVTISEYDPDVLDFELNPHGIVFNRDVTLVIDFSGTAADPDCPLYDGSVPELRYFNPESGVWEPMGGTSDPDHKQFTAKLPHFSRYSLSTKKGKGTADW